MAGESHDLMLHLQRVTGFAAKAWPNALIQDLEETVQSMSIVDLRLVNEEDARIVQ